MRYCPALAKKPEPRKETTPKKKIDPFENPPAELFVTDVNPSHFLVLNKYPVIPNHFILATKENKKQTHVLEQADLEATYACLKAWQAEGSGNDHGSLFAFFNSGDNSGASQPHRHLQFLPVESMHEGEKSAGWDVLVKSILRDGIKSMCLGGDRADLLTDLATDDDGAFIKHPGLPFEHFGCVFRNEPSGTHLVQAYTALYRRAKQAIDAFISTNPGQFSLHDTADGDLPISYNMAMTTEGMAIVPRRAEGHMLKRADGTDIGLVQLNGTVLGGTLMVKFEEEWDTLRQHPETLDAILETIGLPRTGQELKL